jgi:hypothetical protein
VGRLSTLAGIAITGTAREGAVDPTQREPARRFRVVLVVAAVALCLLVVASVARSIVEVATTPSETGPIGAAEPGDCVRTKGEEPDVDAWTVECAEPRAIWKVAAVVDDSADCPRGDYDEIWGSDPQPGFRLCLMLNVRAGDCFSTGSEPLSFSRMSDMTSVACSSPDRGLEIVRVVRGRAEASACTNSRPSSDQKPSAIVYSQPARTLCVHWS